MSASALKVPMILFGGDYNPDQWPREVWDEDVRLMKDAGVNTVTVGVFSWSTIEPQEGVFSFDWLDEVMDLMAANDIRVVLATPTASPPPWFTLAHPEGLPITKAGVRLIHGSRDTYNPSSTAYREAAKRVTRELVQRYAQHPALLMWHLHNEYGTISYGPQTDAAFRSWLCNKYGTIQQLNHVWNSRFWSQQYSTWEEIFAPQDTQYLPNPTAILDFKRFCADQLRAVLGDQVEIVRALSPDVPLTTNFMLPTWNHYNQWDFAQDIDVVSIDHYLDSTSMDGEAHVAFASELSRSFNNGQPWMVMEQATTVIYDYAAGRMFPKAPGRMARNTLQYIAHGSNSSLFFQWRTPRTGAEFFHSGMIPHTGEDTRGWREIVSLGQTLQKLASLTEAPIAGERTNAAKIAIVWEPDAWWAAETRAMPSSDIAFLPAVRDVHKALWLEGYAADFVQLGAPLDDYDLVLIPNFIAVSDEQAANLSAYVRSGGHTAVWYFSGSADENLNVRIGDSFTAAFAEVLGVKVDEHWPLVEGEHRSLSNNMRGYSWGETVRPTTASTLATYASSDLAAVPAITRNAYGKGIATYISTKVCGEDLRELVRELAHTASIAKTHPQAGDGLEIVRRNSGERTYLFVLNHTDSQHTVTAYGRELLTGTTVDSSITVEPHGYAVIEEESTTN
ncbi:beta-galactosidase [Populibacterium corticicola]|uniref:Beta-galactosidase n=1 Tax=Populibacterium corticicola TaxID=1812826 RepID=A0ABW5XHG3_9MICO